MNKYTTRKYAFIASFFIAALPFFTNAQDFTSNLYVPRVGDKLQVEQVGYVLPGGNGEGQQWDISRLNVIRPKHRILYIGEDESLCFTKIEDMAMTYYTLRGDTLVLTGFESNTTKMLYDLPELLMRFPLSFRDSIAGYIFGWNVFSDKMMTRIYGKSLSETDASGSMLLPSGDVLSDVVRLHTRRIIGGKDATLMEGGQGIPACIDSIHPFSRDSIEMYLSADTTQTIVDTYRWFVAGYRYPILRTVRVSDTGGNTLSLAAYYFSPKRQEELNDPDNERIRAYRHEQDIASNTFEDRESSKNDNAPIDYNITISGRTLTIDYSLNVNASVRILLCDVRGIVYRSLSANNTVGNGYVFTLDCNGLRTGEYVLYVNVNGIIYSNKAKIG